MRILYDLFIIPYYARQIIASGRSWNLAYSLAIVVASFVTFDVWAKDSGCRLFGLAAPYAGVDLGSSMFTLMLFLGVWAVATIITSIKRAQVFDQPVGVDIEAQCLALPFVLVWPAIAIIKFLPLVISNEFWTLINNKPANFPPYNLALALLINIVIFIVLAVILITALALMGEPGNQMSPKDSMSRQIAKLYERRLAAHRRSSFASVASAASLIILGGLCWGYQDIFSDGLRLTPITRSVYVAGFSIAFWIVMSWLVGKCRMLRSNDPLGMNMAISSIAWSMARFAIVIISAALMRALFGKSSFLDPIILKLVLLAAIPMSIDAFLNASSVLVLAHRKPVNATSEDEENGGAAVVEEVQPDKPTCYQLSLVYFSRLRFLPLRTILSNIWKMMTLKGIGILKAKPGSDEAIGINMMAMVILVAAAVMHGAALSKVGIPAFGRFAGIGLRDIDYRFGLSVVPIYALTTLAVLYAVLRIMKQATPVFGLLAVVGHSLFGPMVAMMICTVLPKQLGFELAKTLYPVAMLWAAGFCILEIGSALVKRSQLKTVMPAAAITIALTYMIVTQFVSAAHVSVLASLPVPIVDMGNMIYYEIPPALGGDLSLNITKLPNVDLVGVRAGELVRHVMLVNSIDHRFYKDDQPELRMLRIRNEVTSSKAWIVKLKPIMAKVTRTATNPDDAVGMVSKWVRSIVPKPEIAAYPFGEKFDQDPITTLNCRCGNTLDVAILMVAALRSSGVAARIVEVMPDEYVAGTYSLVEYYDGDIWKPCYPTVDLKRKPQTLISDLDVLQTWAEKMPEPARLTFYVQVNGIWYPYCAGGRAMGEMEPGTFSYDLPPGTYLATYVDEEMSTTKKFVLRPASNPL